MPRKTPRLAGRRDAPRWPSWGRGDRDGPGTSLTSRRGLRVEVRREEAGWAVRPGDHPDVAWSRCSDAELERTLGLTLGLDAAEATVLARHVRELPGPAG